MWTQNLKRFFRRFVRSFWRWEQHRTVGLGLLYLGRISVIVVLDAYEVQKHGGCRCIGRR